MGDSAGPTFDCGLTWTIENFPSIATNKMFKSPLFSGGADDIKVDWELQLYPYGYSKGFVSLSLRLASCNTTEIDVNFKLSIINKNNEKCNTMKNTSKFGAFNVFVYQSFVKRAELMDETNGLLVDNNLKIHCIIRIGRHMKYESLPSMERRNAVWPESSLPVNFWQLYVNQKLVDVTVEVSGKEFMVHRAVLAARSPVFSSMFNTNMVESNTNRVVISDIEPEVFFELLRFMYLDQAENLDKVACGLLACAEKYGLERLKVICEESIRANLSVESAADVLLLADLHRATWLKRKALDFIKVHSSKITETDGWKTLLNHQHLVTEVFQSLAAPIDDK